MTARLLHGYEFGGYIEYPLSREASPLVDRLWAVARFRRPPEDHVVRHLNLPDPRAGLVVRRLFEESGRLDRVISYLHGPKTKPGVVSFDAHSDSFGLRLNPEWLPSLCGLSALDLRDRWVDVRDLPKLAKDLDTVAERYDDPLLAAVHLMERVNHLFRSRSRGREPSPVVCCASSMLQRSAGRAHVSSLGQGLVISDRHLRRLVKRETGHSPKRLSRIWRFHRAVREAERRANVPWATLAAELGFSDQAHLVREFRSFSHMTPVELMHQRRKDRASWRRLHRGR